MMGRFTGSRLSLAGCVLALLLSPGRVAAQESEVGATSTTAAPSGAAALGSWSVATLDSLVAAANVPGAVLAVVSACSTHVLHGVGHADLERREPMDASRTRVRVGSISKVLTATTALRLAEAGTVDLHRPITDYLNGLELDWTYPEPVTLHHLLTHTSGLPDRFARSGVASPSKQQSLAEYFASSLPTQQRRPGEVKIYSSHGLALAGLVVEQVAGRPFAEVAARGLFAPLGMEHTSFHIPVDDPDLAVGYKPDGRALSADYHFHIAPGADAVTTAADMARFLRFQLGCAPAGDTTPLGPDGLARLQATHFRNAPGLPGMAYGWEEWPVDGERWLRKTGSAPGFMSLLAIHPERGIGVFLSYNTDMHPLHARFLYALARRTGGEKGTGPVTASAEPGDETVMAAAGSDDARLKASPSTVSESRDHAVRLAGWYRHLRYDVDSWEKLMKSPLFGGTVRVDQLPDGNLRIGGGTFEPRGGLLFERPDGLGRVAFRPGEDGRAQYLFINGSDGHERLPWYETPPVQKALLLGALVLFIAVLPGWLVARIRSRGSVWLDAAAGASILNLAFVGGFAMLLRRTEIWDVHYGTPTLLTTLSVLPFTAALLLAGTVLVRLAGGGGGRRRTPAVSLLMVAVLTAEAAFVVVLHAWNLFGIVR